MSPPPASSIRTAESFEQGQLDLPGARRAIEATADLLQAAAAFYSQLPKASVIAALARMWPAADRRRYLALYVLSLCGGPKRGYTTETNKQIAVAFGWVEPPKGALAQPARRKRPSTEPPSPNAVACHIKRLIEQGVLAATYPLYRWREWTVKVKQSDGSTKITTGRKRHGVGQRQLRPGPVLMLMADHLDDGDRHLGDDGDRHLGDDGDRHLGDDHLTGGQEPDREDREPSPKKKHRPGECRDCGQPTDLDDDGRPWPRCRNCAFGEPQEIEDSPTTCARCDATSSMLSYVNGWPLCDDCQTWVADRQREALDG